MNFKFTALTAIEILLYNSNSVFFCTHPHKLFMKCGI